MSDAPIDTHDLRTRWLYDREGVRVHVDPKRPVDRRICLDIVTLCEDGFGRRLSVRQMGRAEAARIAAALTEAIRLDAAFDSSEEGP